MSWQPLSPSRAVRRTMRIDPETSNLVLRSDQDVTQLLQLNQAFFNADLPSSTLWAGRSYVRVAQVPLLWVEQLLARGMNVLRDPEAQAKMLAMLSSNEYERFRTARGRLA